MILKKALLLAAAAGAILAAAACLVVALAFALYAAVEPMWGSAGAAAAVAGAAFLLMLLMALALAIKAGLGRREPSMAEKLLAFAREKPLVAAAAAIAASFVAVKNPSTLMAMVLAFMEGKNTRKH